MAHLFVKMKFILDKTHMGLNIPKSQVHLAIIGGFDLVDRVLDLLFLARCIAHYGDMDRETIRSKTLQFSHFYLSLE